MGLCRSLEGQMLQLRHSNDANTGESHNQPDKSTKLNTKLAFGHTNIKINDFHLTQTKCPQNNE
jgi:hypothetical protein